MVVWCNGNTSDFGSDVLGSSPDTTTKNHRSCALFKGFGLSC